MIRMLKTIFLVERTDKKTLFALLAIAIFSLAISIYSYQIDLGNPIAEKSNESLTVKVALNKFQVVDATENGPGSPLYKNVVQQDHAYTKQGMALKVERPELYLESALRLTQLRKDAFTMDEYDKVADIMPQMIENELDYYYYSYLAQLDSPPPFEAYSYTQFLMYLLGFVGAFWFLIIAVYSSNIMIEDFRHTTLIKGYPIAFDRYVLAKVLVTWSITCLFVLTLLVFSLPYGFLGDWGALSSVISVWNGEVEIHSVLSYSSFAIGYMLLLSLVAIVSSVILNVLVRNVYITVFIQLGLVALPLMFPRLASLVPWYPYHYVNFPALLRGESLLGAYPAELSASMGLIILSIYLVLLLALVKWFLSSGKLQRA